MHKALKIMWQRQHTHHEANANHTDIYIHQWQLWPISLCQSREWWHRSGDPSSSLQSSATQDTSVIQSFTINSIINQSIIINIIMRWHWSYLCQEVEHIESSELFPEHYAALHGLACMQEHKFRALISECYCKQRLPVRESKTRRTKNECVL